MQRAKVFTRHTLKYPTSFAPTLRIPYAARVSMLHETAWKLLRTIVTHRGIVVKKYQTELVHPGNDGLAALLGMSCTTVRRWLRVLVDLDMIHIVHQGGLGRRLRRTQGLYDRRASGLATVLWVTPRGMRVASSGELDRDQESMPALDYRAKMPRFQRRIRIRDERRNGHPSLETSQSKPSLPDGTAIAVRAPIGAAQSIAPPALIAGRSAPGEGRALEQKAAATGAKSPAKAPSALQEAANSVGTGPLPSVAPGAILGAPARPGRHKRLTNEDYIQTWLARSKPPTPVGGDDGTP